MANSRSRASTVSYSESEAASLGGQLNKLRSMLGKGGERQAVDGTESKIKTISCVRQLITNNPNPNRIRDAFRHQDGFQLCLESLRSFTKGFVETKKGAEAIQECSELSSSLLGLLTAALQDHWGNRKYFRKRVEGGGWIALESILSAQLQKWEESSVDPDAAHTQLFGAFFACAMERDSLNDLYLELRSHLRGRPGHGEEPKADALQTSLSEDHKDAEASRLINAALAFQPLLHNPEIIPLAVKLWLHVSRSTSTSGREAQNGLYFLPEVVNRVIEISTHNLLALHSSGLLRVIFATFDDTSLSLYHRFWLHRLALALLKFGINELDDAHFLYSTAASSPEVAELLRGALEHDKTPPFLHFDLALHGFASIELSDIGRTFPPASGAGYTLSMWLQVVHFDPDSHTTIFGAFDSSQTCFILVYLEKDTHNLILQTSVTSSRPSVRFKSFVFEANRWYHLCLIHKRPKSTASSRASLFIDGEFVEQIKAHYPSSPPPAGPSTDIAGILSPGRRHKPVQVFLGTPQDLASKIGKGLVLSQWRVASAHLFNDALSDDLIAVHKQLGPIYHGNYQDCLGSFQTYEASAALNLRNESLHPGKEEKSEIVAAIRSKASGILPEHKIILNFSPTGVIVDEEQSIVLEAQLIKSLSKSAAKNLRALTRGGRTAIVINGAIPSINEALLHPHGVAVLTGDPAVVVPQRLDDAAWRIGGCASVGLALVEAAQGREAIVRALDILFASIRDSWRNSEAMERENGFGVLASLLTEKLGGEIHEATTSRTQAIAQTEEDRETLTFEVLSLILQFIGYRKESLADSVINNPLAYRILIVDLDIWRRSPSSVQKLYYEQFVTFGAGSKHRNFNAKRLARMREF